MKKVIFTLGVCLFTKFGLAQTPKKLTDTSMAVGVIKNDFACYTENMQYGCWYNSGKFLKAGESIIIAGIENCIKDSDTTHFFKIIVDSIILYVIEEHVATAPNIYNQINNFTSQQQLNFEQRAKYYASAIKYANLLRLSKFFKTCEKRGLQLLDWTLYDESEYTKGTGVKFDILNTGKKTIKYISFTIVGLNPVGDAVMAKMGVYTITLKGVGPIEPDEAATFSFDYTWMSDLPETANIKSVKVQFMDNTFSTISNPKEIVMSEELKTISERLDK
jgi:hypothetical protein